MAVNPKIAELEQKYIELLEKKVAKLESEQNSKDGKPASSSRRNSASSTTAVNGDASESPKSKVSAAEGPSTAESSISHRIRFLDRKYNKEGYVEDTNGAPTIKEGKDKPETTAHAMTVMRAFDQSGKYNYSLITIDDDGLRALMLNALAHHPWLSHSTTTLAFYSLYEPIIHNWSWLTDLAYTGKPKPMVSDFHEEIRQKGSSLAGTSNGLLAPLMAAGGLEKATADLRLLLDEVRRTPGLESYFNGVREMQESTETVFFEHLWTIFPPGELVFSSAFMDRPQAFIVRHCLDNSNTSKGSSGEEKWILECWAYDWTGTVFHRVPVEFSFEDFKGTKSITSLPCYPLRFHPNSSDDVNNAGTLKPGEVMMQKLIKRGERYRELCLKKKGWQIFEYEGDLLARGTGVRKMAIRHHDNDTDLMSSSSFTSFDQHSEAGTETPSRKQRIKKDRVMVDFSSYIQHGPEFIKFPPMGDIKFVLDEDDDCKCGTCSANEKLKNNQKPHYDDVTTASGWEETHLLICPPRLLGYHLKGKRWVELDVETVRNIEKLKDKTSFDRLELNKPQKNLIEKLVTCHASGSENKNRAMNDLSQGKGNGLGVGKTLTAESVAEASGKPLFSIGVSDVGLNPAEVEQRLGVLFELAATWRAVMLFDEADVFLESRSSNTANLERNALVSILLRVLEYYDGILILTTNRLKTFDIAVQSRVNFAIRYHDLDDKQKRSIYKNFIRQLTDHNTDDKQQLLGWLDDEEQIEEYGGSPFKELNGRQIRNVLFSAASIAQGDSDKRLKLEHIRKILRETTTFVTDMKYMVQVARGEAEVAYSRK